MVIGWIGSVCMVAASWILPHPMAMIGAIIGLCLLTIQAWRINALNLIALNVASIAGFTFSLTRIL